MRLNYLILAGFILLVFSTCNKEENTRYDYNKGIEASRSFVTAEQMTVQLLNTFFKSITDSVLMADGMAKIDNGDVFYYSEPQESIEIRYPYWSKIDSYGHRRANIYEAIPRTNFSDPKAVIDIVFTDFYYDYDTITVQNMVISKLGKVDGENEHYQVSVDRIYRTYADTTGVLSFNFDQQIIRYKDPETEYTSPNDKFVISGEMVGVTKSALSFSSVIDVDLTLETDFSCNWLRLGPAAVITERFDDLSYVYFAEPDSCKDECLIVINDNPFPYPID